MDEKSFYQKNMRTQISFTEWFEKIDHHLTEEMRREDNEKRERLRVLQRYLNIPFDEPVKFEAVELAQETSRLQSFVAKRASELCALRLIPKEDDLPKLRFRGHTIAQALAWFKEQTIHPENYRAEFMPHTEKTEWSTIFVVTPNGVFGEIIRGGHYQLTQGFYDGEKPMLFSYDFTSWNLSDADALIHMKGILKKLKVDDIYLRQQLSQELQATFAGPYLCGYFETVFTLDFGLWFVDYNRILDKMYKDFKQDFKVPLASSEHGLVGISASPGKAQGKVRIVESCSKDFLEGDILVCSMTTPDFIPLMKKAAAIITDKGGVLSHAAIVAREMKKPCIVGMEKATSLLKNGDFVEVDAEKGIVKKVNKTI